MAGRGTDIKLSAAAVAAGGLHVISCQHNASRRIDHQLHGRAARQGDPGSVETLLSLQEGLLLRHLSAESRGLLSALAGRSGTLPGWLSRVLVRRVQRVEERRARTDRARVMKNDEEMDRRLGLGGPGE
jgi:preprotein translocase subunit SecA